MLRLITTKDEIRQFSREQRAQGRRIALVPTMGALHEGHISLVTIGRELADVVVVTVFVNPTQFSPTEDLSSYPRQLQQDMEALEAHEVEAVFAPSDAAMYPEGFATYVEVGGLTSGLCGASRPTHFRGVTTIVAKLFNLVEPDVAVFGEKDYQQLAVIRQMSYDLDSRVEVVGAPIVREPDGLAMSSRNKNLTAAQRSVAPAIRAALLDVRAKYREGVRDGRELIELTTSRIEAHEELRIDYAELVDPDDLSPLVRPTRETLGDRVHMALAVFAGDTRLIDNLRISDEQD